MSSNIKFYDYSLPKLPAGNYEITIEQTLEFDNQVKTFQSKQAIMVDAPQYALTPGDIHSIYPPADGQGVFENTLPQVVFRKKSLPWLRSASANGKTPWMALLVLEEGELLIPDLTSATRTGAYNRTISEIKNPPTNFIAPALTDSPANNDSNTRCFAIDITGATFNDIMPIWEDLPYLAHVRQVNTDEKEDLGMQEDGWFSVVFANRLPLPQATNGASARNVVHLVSIEGFEKYLQGEPVPANKNVRLVSLTSWEFYCEEQQEDFDTLMQTLLKDLNTDADNQLLKVNVPTKAGSETQTYIQNAINNGYLPFQYLNRLDEKTVAWYRGPLSPNIINYDRKDVETPYSVEAAMIYDNQKGLYDLSYAVAWQIGRLLGLSDESFSTSILQWKRNANAFVNSFLAKRDLLKEIESDYLPTDMNVLMSNQLTQNILTNYLKKTFLGNVDGNARTAMDVKGDLKYLEQPDYIELEGMPGIMDGKNFMTLLQSGENPNMMILKEMMEGE